MWQKRSRHRGFIDTLYFKERWPMSLRTDPVTIGAITVALGLAGAAGGTMAIEAQTASKKATKNAMQDQLDLQKRLKADEEAAGQKAQDAITADRRKLLASGGVTDITAGTGKLLSGETTARTLLGG